LSHENIMATSSVSESDCEPTAIWAEQSMESTRQILGKRVRGDGEERSQWPGEKWQQLPESASMNAFLAKLGILGIFSSEQAKFSTDEEQVFKQTLKGCVQSYNPCLARYSSTSSVTSQEKQRILEA
jgi:hypothetical protein